MFTYLKQIDIKGLRYPKIFQYNNKTYLSGSQKYDQKENIVKYGACIMELDTSFNIINNFGFIEFKQDLYLNDITKTAWIRDITIKNDVLYFNVEIKKNVDNQTFYDKNMLMSTSNLHDFIIIKEYNVTDFLFKDMCYKNDHYLFSSKIGKDLDNPDFFWGIYLFNIIKNDTHIQPQFDAIVDYTKDKGHVIHNIEYDELRDEHTMYFTIRHMVDKSVDNSGFIYKIYRAETKDLINYYNTREVELVTNMYGDDILTNKPNWHSYPHYFKKNNVEYIICNQDDYGKYTEPLIYKK